MTFVRSLALSAALMLCATSAQAQRYRVSLDVPNGKQTLAEFRPCVPAEGSGCGAWVDRTIVAGAVVLPFATRAVSMSGQDSVTVENGAIRLKSLRGPRAGKVILLHVGKGTAKGLTISADSRYAFVVVENPTGNPVDVMMIDLESQNAVAGLEMATKVLGIAMGGSESH